MADDGGAIGFLILMGVIGALFLAVPGWGAALGAPTIEAANCTWQVQNGTESQVCDFHVESWMKSNSWTLTGIILIAVLIYIGAEIYLIHKARKDSWFDNEWEFLGANLLLVVGDVLLVGVLNFVQAWLTIIDWKATTIFVLSVILWILIAACVVLIIYTIKKCLWDVFVVPARKEEKRKEEERKAFEHKLARIGKPRGRPKKKAR